jgi:hypothetical protein
MIRPDVNDLALGIVLVRHFRIVDGVDQIEGFFAGMLACELRVWKLLEAIFCLKGNLRSLLMRGATSRTFAITSVPLLRLSDMLAARCYSVEESRKGCVECAVCGVRLGRVRISAHSTTSAETQLSFVKKQSLYRLQTVEDRAESLP